MQTRRAAKPPRKATTKHQRLFRLHACSSLSLPCFSIRYDQTSSDRYKCASPISHRNLNTSCSVTFRVGISIVRSKGLPFAVLAWTTKCRLPSISRKNSAVMSSAFMMLALLARAKQMHGLRMMTCIGQRAYRYGNPQNNNEIPAGISISS